MRAYHIMITILFTRNIARSSYEHKVNLVAFLAYLGLFRPFQTFLGLLRR